MLLEKYSNVITIAAIALSLLSMLRTLFSTIQLNRLSNFKSRIPDRNLSVDDVLSAILESSKESDYVSLLDVLSDRILTLYPNSKPTISIKMVRHSDSGGSILDSRVVTVVTYPAEKNGSDIIHYVKDNTDFCSILLEDSEYFWVSDLKKYSILHEYKNSDKDYLQKYNTSIVCPIRKDKKSQAIGFLCVDSLGTMGDVNKNKHIMEWVQLIADFWYVYWERSCANAE